MPTTKPPLATPRPRPVAAVQAAYAPPPAPTPDPEVVFNRGPARRPVPRVADPLLQWSTGLSTQQRTIYAGWLCETGRDAALDDAMQAAGYETVTIKHGGGNLVTHWAVETAHLFVVAEGVQSIGEMKGTAERYGVAFGWRSLDDGRRQSQLRARCFLRPLLEVGYHTPMLLSVKSTITGDVIAALMQQYAVLDAAAAERRAKGLEPHDLPYYAFSLDVGPGEAVQRGSKGAQKEVVPPVAVRSAPIDRAYLLAHYIRKEWVPLVERLVEPTTAWSVATSAELASVEAGDVPYNYDDEGGR